MNLKKALSFFLLVTLLSASCTRKLNEANDYSGEAAADYYFINEIYPWLYSIEEADHNVYCYLLIGSDSALLFDSNEWAKAMESVVYDLPPGNLGAFELTLKDNFLYGNGYQGLVRDYNMLNGHRLRKGEAYTLKVTYTASRDLENDLLVGFVDMAGGRWNSLGKYNGNKTGALQR